MQSLADYLIAPYRPAQPQPGMDLDALARIILDEVLSTASAGDLDEEFLPNDLQTALRQPEGHGAVSQIIAGNVRVRKAEWMHPPNQPPPAIDYTGVILEVIEKLRMYLVADPLLVHPVPLTGP